MSGREDALYQRGKYWLGWDTKKDGTLRSPNLTVFWYDDAKGRVCSASTGTNAITPASKKLDLKWLADSGEAAAYCSTCGQPLGAADAYLLTDAIADYKLEWGDHQTSADSIAARLKHVVDFLEVDDQTGLATSCAVAAGMPFITRFRTWSRKQPVTWQNGQGEITVSRARAPATTEESVIQLIAALNHACDAVPSRSDSRPNYHPLSRKHVSPKRKIRCDVPVLADMLAYAKGDRHRRSLHAFIVASICTVARPDSVMDISTDPVRRQWRHGADGLDLNPTHRIQTKKYRPFIPVVGPLADWLADTLHFAGDKGKDRTNHWLVNFYGRPIQRVDTAWDRMLAKLGIAPDREWMPYVLRHSLSTILRGRGATKWDLEGFTGHRSGDTIETYAVGQAYPSVVNALLEVLAEIETRCPGVLHRDDTGFSNNVVLIGGQKMT
ncbi:MAG: hypothetical protein JWQ16_1738 [Novosphingobium sp.]|nr:hypothetical protein [Novosphingobium sp.]